MAEHLQHVRHGFGSVRPYVYGHLRLWDLVKDAFGAIELERHQVGPKAFHIEARIGDSMIVLEIADPPHPQGKQVRLVLQQRLFRVFGIRAIS
jgi:hypothetical protein